MPDDNLESFLGRPLIAKLCTHNKDGTIHIAPIWFNYDSGEILLGTQELTQKVQNIKRNNRVTVLIDTTEPNLAGAIIYGQARLDYDEIITKRASIFGKYMDPSNAPGLATKLASQWKPVVIRIKPERIISFDYSIGFGISADPEAASMKIV